MNYDHTQQLLARIGLESLKHAVLLVLYKQHISGGRQRLRPREIRDVSGISEYDEDSRLIRGVLSYLEADGYVKPRGRGNWEITPAGVEHIEFYE